MVENHSAPIIRSDFTVVVSAPFNPAQSHAVTQILTLIMGKLGLIKEKINTEHVKDIVTRIIEAFQEMYDYSDADLNMLYSKLQPSSLDKFIQIRYS